MLDTFSLSPICSTNSINKDNELNYMPSSFYHGRSILWAVFLCVCKYLQNQVISTSSSNLLPYSFALFQPPFLLFACLGCWKRFFFSFAMDFGYGMLWLIFLPLVPSPLRFMELLLDRIHFTGHFGMRWDIQCLTVIPHCIFLSMMIATGCVLQGVVCNSLFLQYHIIMSDLTTASLIK